MGASWTGLLQNLAILAILVSVWTHGLDWIDGKTRWGREALGIGLAGGGVILLMTFPFEMGPGVISDLRVSLIALAGFLGSPLIGAATGLSAGIYRIGIGGAGAFAGTVSIVIATLVGIGAHLALRGRMPRRRDLLVFSAATAASSLVGFLFLPAAMVLPMLGAIGLPIATTTFVASLISGLAVLDADRRRLVGRTNLIFRAIIDALPDALNAKDLDGRFIAVNPATARLMEAGSVDALLGKTDFDFYPAEAAGAFRADEERMLADQRPVLVEHAVRSADGPVRWLSTLKAPFYDGSGKLAGLLTHNRDITERKRLEGALEQGRQRLDDALTHMADGLVMYDRDARIVMCNEQYRSMFPATADLRVPGARLEDILRASIERDEQTDIPADKIDMWVRHMLATFTRAGDRDIHLKDGRWLAARQRPMADGGCLAVFSDITATKAAEAALSELNHRLANLASTDALTGLANRRAYDTAVQQEFARSLRSNTPLSLLLIDVDRFKAYNDTYGHPAGDECLRQVARCLTAAAQRPGDLAARYGGEEFAVILPDTESHAARYIAELIHAAVRDIGLPHTGSERGIVTVSIGVATAGTEHSLGRREDLARAADEALYAAKASGRDRVSLARPRPPLAAVANG